MNSDAPTPRTEQEVEHASNVALYISTGKHGYKEETHAWVVPADFARQLERELNEARAELERLREQAENMQHDLRMLRDHA